MTLDPLTDDLRAEAHRQADAAAAARGIAIRGLETVAELRALELVFEATWGPKGMAIVPLELAQALRYAGNYVVGAYDGERMVGGSVGFFGEHGGRRHLHSHITGVVPDLQARSLGFAIKLHQRAWALDAGLEEVVWTFDPLVRRNAYFNLEKLGAEVVGYEVEFYGDAMTDAINAGDETDRGVVRWSIAAPSVAAAVAAVAGRGRSQPGRSEAEASATVILGEGPIEPDLPDPGGAPLLAWVPEDIVRLRGDDPDRALAWRLALRRTMGMALGRGYVAVAMSRDGWYRLERRARSGG